MTTSETLRIDPAQPLDLTHPLLEGLLACWLPLPGQIGGRKIYDLSGYGRHVDSMQNFGDAELQGAWFPDPVVPWPGIDFSVTNSYATATGAGGMQPANFTYIITMRSLGTSIGGNQTLLSKEQGGPWNEVNIEPDANNQVVRLFVSAGGSNTTVEGTTAVYDENVHVIGAQYDGDEAAVFVDGDKENSDTSLSGAADYTSNDPIISARPDTTNIYSGKIYSIMVFDRALTPVEHEIISSFGHPTFEELFNKRPKLY